MRHPYQFKIHSIIFRMKERNYNPVQKDRPYFKLIVAFSLDEDDTQRFKQLYASTYINEPIAYSSIEEAEKHNDGIEITLEDSGFCKIENTSGIKPFRVVVPNSNHILEYYPNLNVFVFCDFIESNAITLTAVEQLRNLAIGRGSAYNEESQELIDLLKTIVIWFD